jgi:predicted amidohydrolase
MLPSDPADLFVTLIPKLEADFNSVTAFDWMADDRVRDIADFVEQAALAEGRIQPDSVDEVLDVLDEDDYAKHLFAVLLGLDRALLHANPYYGSFDQGALVSIAVRYNRTGVLNADSSFGALLPRCSFPGRPLGTPNTVNDAFVGVVWVPEREWLRTAHKRLHARNDLTRNDREEELVIACVPFAEAVDEFTWEMSSQANVRFFRLSFNGDVRTSAEIGHLLDKLDVSGAQIAVIPELVLTDTLADEWIATVSERSRPAESNLKWLFIGSGNVGDANPPRNRCLLLDRVTAEVLLEQDKMFPFMFTPEQLVDWQLTDRLGSDPVEEELTRGRAVTVTESRVGRIVVLICEDLAKLIDLGPSMRSHGVSHVFAPVLSKETLLHHWEHAKAKEYANEAGALVVISNSLAIPRLISAEGPWHTAMIHSPVETQIRTTHSWDDIALFHTRAGDPMSLMGHAIRRGEEG